MLTFLGTTVIDTIIPGDEAKANLAKDLNISPERFQLIVDAVEKSKQAATSHENELICNFELSSFLNGIDFDAESPSEMLFVGMCIGRVYAEMTQKAKQSLLGLLGSPQGLAALLLSMAKKDKPVS